MDGQDIDDQKIRNDLYAKIRDDLLKRQLSNSENADRAVLSVSAAALGFLLAFIKDMVPLGMATTLRGSTCPGFSSWPL